MFSFYPTFTFPYLFFFWWWEGRDGRGRKWGRRRRRVQDRGPRTSKHRVDVDEELGGWLAASPELHHQPKHYFIDCIFISGLWLGSSYLSFRQLFLLRFFPSRLTSARTLVSLRLVVVDSGRLFFSGGLVASSFLSLSVFRSESRCFNFLLQFLLSCSQCISHP